MNVPFATASVYNLPIGLVSPSLHISLRGRHLAGLTHIFPAGISRSAPFILFPAGIVPRSGIFRIGVPFSVRGRLTFSAWAYYFEGLFRVGCFTYIPFATTSVYKLPTGLVNPSLHIRRRGRSPHSAHP